MDFDAIKSKVREKIAKLEAEADPWREAKEAISYWSDNAGYNALWAREAKVIAYVDHLTAENARLADSHFNIAIENERLAARVAELENDPGPAKVTLRRADEVKVGDVILAGGYTQTVTNVEPETTQRIIKCDGWMAWFRNRELVAVINGDSDPDDPILDPARAFATFIEILDKWGYEFSRRRLRASAGDAKPYRLKGAENGN